MAKFLADDVIRLVSSRAIKWHLSRLSTSFPKKVDFISWSDGLNLSLMTSFDAPWQELSNEVFPVSVRPILEKSSLWAKSLFFDENSSDHSEVYMGNMKFSVLATFGFLDILDPFWL